MSSGTFGCVMKPAVRCDKKTVSDKHVSKLFYNPDDAEEEVRNQKQINRIDPLAKFTIALADYCDIDADKYPIEKCDDTFYTARVPQMVYEYGGITLYKASVQVPPRTLFANMRPIFEGLVTLKKKRWVHIDIKPDNILYNLKKNKMVLIDYGTLTRFDKVYVDDNIDYFGTEYIYFPPEFRIFGWKAMTTRLFKNYSKIPVFLEATGYGNWVDEELLRTGSKQKATIPGRIDVYALGVTLLEILSLIWTRDNKAIPAKATEKLMELVACMIVINVNKRYTPEKALAHFDELFPSF